MAEKKRTSRQKRRGRAAEETVETKEEDTVKRIAQLLPAGFRRRKSSKVPEQDPKTAYHAVPHSPNNNNANEGESRIKKVGSNKGTTHKPVTEAAAKAVETFMNTNLEIGVEGLRKMFRDHLQSYRAPDHIYKFTAFESHQDKNRYADIVCLDATRVKLTLDVPPSTDYIHANWVKFDGLDRVYIATQAPLENTIEDFWRMVFQENVATIVNLTKVVEDGKIKSTQYWPLEAGAYQTYGKMFINTKKVEAEDKFTINTIEVLPEGCSNSLVVKMIHVINWPDKGIPMSGKMVLRLIRLITTTDTLASGPVLVHCSAGVGRSGTIIIIDYVLQKLFAQGLNVELVDVFKCLRNQRASCIQQEGQFVFVVSSVMEYIKARLGSRYYDKCEKFRHEFRSTNLSSN